MRIFPWDPRKNMPWEIGLRSMEILDFDHLIYLVLSTYSSKYEAPADMLNGTVKFVSMFALDSS